LALSVGVCFLSHCSPSFIPFHSTFSISPAPFSIFLLLFFSFSPPSFSFLPLLFFICLYCQCLSPSLHLSLRTNFSSLLLSSPLPLCRLKPPCFLPFLLPDQVSAIFHIVAVLVVLSLALCMQFSLSLFIPLSQSLSLSLSPILSPNTD